MEECLCLCRRELVLNIRRKSYDVQKTIRRNKRYEFRILACHPRKEAAFFSFCKPRDGYCSHTTIPRGVLTYSCQYTETYKPKFHCRRQSGMNYGYVTVNGVNSNTRRRNVKNFFTSILISESESYIIALEGRDDNAI